MTTAYHHEIVALTGFGQFDKSLNPCHVPLHSEVDIDDVINGYHVDYDGGDIKYVSFVFPSGSMIATAQDVGIFLRALNDGTLLTEDEEAIYSSVYLYEHTGELPGYQSIARYHENIDAVVIQFTNTSGGNSWMKSESVYRRIIRILEKEAEKSGI